MKTRVLLGLAALAFMLSSCRLLPVEEALPAVPVIRDYEKQEYNQTQVLRGDLILSESVACTYDVIAQENASFSVSGVLIDKLYVTKGQTVKAGDLLYSLNMDNVQGQIDSQKNVIARLELQLDQLYEMRSLVLDKHDYILDELEQQLSEVEQLIADAQFQPPETDDPPEITQPTEQMQDLVAEDSGDNAVPPEDTQPPSEPAEDPVDKTDLAQLLLRQQELLMEKSQQEAARAATVSAYASKIHNIEDALYIQNLRFAEMKQSVQERQIIASIDGTVTFVREFTEGDRSVKGRTMVSVCNWDSAYFLVKGENNVGYFSVDMEVDIQVGSNTHKAVVVDPAEIGATVDPNVPTVYLRLVQADPTITDGKYGTIRIVLDRRENVLYLDRDAIITSGGVTFVYTPDENGLRTLREVKTGLETDQYVEIMEGLQEGDRVILE